MGHKPKKKAPYHPRKLIAAVPAEYKADRSWEAKSTVGRPRIFGNPEDMWAAASEYFEYCIANPLIEIDYRGKDATQVALPKMRAFSIEGCCLFMEVNTLYFRDFEKSIKDKTDETSLRFSHIIARIKEVIWNQQYTGAAAGFLKENIIARKLGLADKQEARQVDKDGNDIAPPPAIQLIQRKATDEADIPETE